MKKLLFSVVILVLSANAVAEIPPPRHQPPAIHLVDVLIYRPVGLVATLAGTALFVGISPLTGLAAISPPHDAFKKMAGILIWAPAKFTFDRPMGVYYPDRDGEYRRKKK